ncbi:TMEM175 family protein (plasmid) [Coraliomargarita sp. W4R53]
MNTSRGLERLIFFSDAVVAIAITLLILPLVESVADFEGADLADYVDEHYLQLLVFALSFVVIGRFWMVHHRMYEKVAGYTQPMLWVNLLWLMSIVFLPFPTALLSASSSSSIHALYIGTILVTSLASLVQQWLIKRDPTLQISEARGTIRMLPFVITPLILAVALTLALAIPSFEVWSVLVLLTVAPIEVLGRRKARA